MDFVYLDEYVEFDTEWYDRIIRESGLDLDDLWIDLGGEG